MWRIVLVVVLVALLAGCSLGGASGAASQGGHTHSEPARRDTGAWAALWVRKLHPKGGAHFDRIRCNVKKRSVVVCTGYLSYGDAPGARVQQFFRIVTSNGSDRLVPVCPGGIAVGMQSSTMPRIFCPDIRAQP
jgi:hypothetical protein